MKKTVSTAFCLVVIAASPVCAQFTPVLNVNLDLAATTSSARAHAYINAEPLEDCGDPPDTADAVFIVDENGEFAIADSSVADASDGAIGSYDGEATCRAYPAGVTSGTGHAGNIASMGANIELCGTDQPLNPSHFPTMESASCTGVYVFNVAPAPPGFAWVASGQFEVQIIANGYLSAGAQNPAVTAVTGSMTGEATATVTDVLDGQRRVYQLEGATELRDQWSCFVGVGNQNPFPLTASSTSGDLGSASSPGESQGFLGSANSFMSIDAVRLVDVSTLPSMQDVLINNDPI